MAAMDYAMTMTRTMLAQMTQWRQWRPWIPIYMGAMTKTTMRLARLRDDSEQGNADTVNGAMTKTKARAMLTRWCYLCYNDKDTGDG